ncbi:hypothetical protein Patl1_36516 [Pistacia atlantica]|nr:hypothetical protein Patl1_36516 [Pistacia atlantica]
MLCNGGKTSSFVRKLEETVDMPLDSDVFQVPPGSNAPQQVHITQGDHEGSAVIVSWVTPDKPGSNQVVYWRENSKENQTATGVVLTYKFYNYTSGYIHHCNISNLEERVSNIAYNITNGDCTPVRDESAPVYIIIGDGGNQEGMTEPQPDYSAYREASYGHGIFDIKNRTHGYFSWHRNQDVYVVEADQKWFFNRYWNQVDDC